MNESQRDIRVEKLISYSEEDARDIGLLMPMLSSRFDAAPISEDLLRRIIASDSADQLVARLESDLQADSERSRIIGVATVSLVFGAGMHQMAYLQDFVVDSDVRGLGVGRKLFREVVQWASDHDAPLEFTSGNGKQAAHALYLSEGAKIRETNIFRVEPHSDTEHPSA